MNNSTKVRYVTKTESGHIKRIYHPTDFNASVWKNTLYLVEKENGQIVFPFSKRPIELDLSDLDEMLGDQIIAITPEDTTIAKTISIPSYSFLKEKYWLSAGLSVHRAIHSRQAKQNGLKMNKMNLSCK